MTYTPMSKQKLAFLPTPVAELEQLTARLGGPKLYIKRDDQTGLALGGNKTRKLEFILADALKKGADTIITAGAGQSNHCRQTAAAAAKLQMECHLVLGGEAPPAITGNLLLDNLFGAHVHWAGENRKGEDIPELVKQLKSQGKQPYVVPYGGSNELGALAYLEAFKELQLQQQQQQISFTHIVFASSSGGTHAGLALGAKIFNSQCQIIGINNDKGEGDAVPLQDKILTLANQTATMINAQVKLDSADIQLNNHYIGQGYGVISQQDKAAISLLATAEGILLDPVYTARAMSALLDMIRTNQFSSNDNILFWHTGGAPALFAYADKLGC
ncbi:D-cysteine desulfhydrase family protein [Neptunicella sp. SCSIO 80796]|uniref:D-cysteine desulfhydrase family protein n=1 Tax=Neptunicella plasticusilytica TaxID=3117012 RepID=UPI003A4DB409